MATQDSEPQSTVHETDKKSFWWLFSLMVVVAIVVWVVAGLVNTKTPFTVPESLWLWTFIILVIVGSLGSLAGYHMEARHFKKQNSAWVPNRWRYTVVHIILTPLVTTPIYLLQRWRHVGLDWP